MEHKYKDLNFQLLISIVVIIFVSVSIMFGIFYNILVQEKY